MKQEFKLDIVIRAPEVKENPDASDPSAVPSNGQSSVAASVVVAGEQPPPKDE